MYASSSARPLEALPSLAALQSWVHRPQARAQCFVSDVYALQALREETATMARTTRGKQLASVANELMADVFLLNHFPCKFVELVGWVAGVDHRDTTVTITCELKFLVKLTAVDDGDGEAVLSVVVKLAEVKVIVPKEEKKERRMTFRSARERNLARPPPPAAKVYVRPDIRVGDTVRVAGAVDEWMRRDGAVRQVVVDEASGSGYIRELIDLSAELTTGVVDPDEQYTHVETVARLHREVYSQLFVMPPIAPTPSMLSSPAKSVASTWDLSSEVDVEDVGPELPDPAKLSSSRLTETTFKLYLMDYMVRETSKAMRAAVRVLFTDSSAQVPELAALFPEYAECTVPSARVLRPSPSPSPSQLFPERMRRASHTPLSRRSTELSTTEVFAPSRAGNTPSCETPRPRATFRSKVERQAAKKEQECNKDPSPSVSTPRAPKSQPATFRSKAERERDRKQESPFVVATPRATHLADSSFLSRLDAAYEPFTVTSLLEVERLHALAVRVIDTRARREENERRQRARDGTSTRRDEALVTARRARGLRSSDYKLTTEEREGKLRRLAEWAIRAAAAEGALVQVEVDGAQHSLRTMASFDSCVSLVSSGAGYVPVPPELLGPLLIPLAAAERAERATRRSTFRSKAERERGPRPFDAGVDAKVLLARLRRWGEEGRWERVGEWAVEAAAEWAEAAGLLRLGV